MTAAWVLSVALVAGSLLLISLRSRALARPLPTSRLAAPLSPRERVRLRRWERRLRSALWLLASAYVGLVAIWLLTGGEGVDPRLALALLALLAAAGALAQFSARCPRCGFNLGFQSGLRLPEGCERCGGRLR